MISRIRTFFYPQVNIRPPFIVVQKRKKESILPYPDSGSVRQSLYLLQKIFPIRHVKIRMAIVPVHV